MPDKEASRTRVRRNLMLPSPFVRRPRTTPGHSDRTQPANSRAAFVRCPTRYGQLVRQPDDVRRNTAILRRASLAPRLLIAPPMHRTTLASITLSLSVTAASAGTTASPVVGGKTVKPGTWPEVVAVLTSDGSLCTGTLLEADLVLTAGHCTDAQPVEVIIGSVDLAGYAGERREVKWSRSYPNWDTEYDVGVVMLEYPVAVKPSAIAQGCSTDDELARGEVLQVVGFGLTTKAGIGNNTKLHQAKISVVDADCTQDAACEANVAPGGEFVAGGQGADACFGDSGGPVYVTTQVGPAVIGVVSRGLVNSKSPCGDGGVFVRADKVAKWIEKVSGRKLQRRTCDSPADSAGTVDDGGGCSAGGSGAAAGLALALAFLTALWFVSTRPLRIGQ